MVRLPDRDPVYNMAHRWAERCLASDESLFSQTYHAWTMQSLEDIHERFIAGRDESDDRFMVKLERQLAGARHETVLLFAEMMYVHLLIAHDTGGAAKRRTINQILSWMPEQCSIPDDLSVALERGIANVGPARMHLPNQLRFLTEFALKFKSCDESERSRLLSDPWAFHETVMTTETPSAQTQKHALIHLIFPDTFEPIVSEEHKRQIVSAFRFHRPGTATSLDQELLKVRQLLNDRFGREASYYAPEIEILWRTRINEWDAFVQWGKRFHEWETFDEWERDYKLRPAKTLAEVREALVTGGDWIALIERAFKNTDQNLVRWQAYDRFLKWMQTHPEDAKQSLLALWSSDTVSEDGIRRFFDLVPISRDVLSSPGERVSVLSFLTMGVDPYRFPPYKASAFQKAYALTGYSPPTYGTSHADVYCHALGFLDRMIEESLKRGLVLRDRLDAQGVMWAVTK